MAVMNYLAILGLIAGCAYLVMAVVAFNHSRKRRAEKREGEEAAGQMILGLEHVALLEDEPTYDRMRKLAAICATTSQKVFSEQFDFSAESIARLDRAIMKGWSNTDAEADQQVILSFGAYLGEVLVRRTKGRWVTGMTGSDPATILFLRGDDETVSVSPFMLITEKFDNMYKFDLSIAFTALEQKLKELQVV